MFLPLRDDNQHEFYPAVVIGLIAVNVIVFFIQLSLSRTELTAFMANFALYPVELISGMDLPPLRDAFIPRWLPLITSMFLHGGVFHIFGNMYYLWIFGDNIEDLMGPLRFLIFYFICGIVAALVYIFQNPTSNLPMVGASGAISGVLGAYFFLYPKNRVYTLIFLFPIIMRVVPIPAFFFLGFWFLQQVISAPFGGQVAWFAHIGGFLAGVTLAPLFIDKKLYKKRLSARRTILLSE